MPDTLSLLNFIVTALIVSIIGGVIGSGSVAIMIRKAMTETLRQTFVAKGEAVTHADLEEFAEKQDRNWKETLREEGARIRTSMETAVSSVGVQLLQQNSAHEREFKRIASGLDMAVTEAREAKDASVRALNKQELAEEKSSSFREVIELKLTHLEAREDWNRRLSRIESLVSARARAEENEG